MILETIAGVIGGGGAIVGAEMGRRESQAQARAMEREVKRRKWWHKRPVEHGGGMGTYVIEPKKESKWKLKPKKCTHQHAFRGTCLTCGEENV